MRNALPSSVTSGLVAPVSPATSSSHLYVVPLMVNFLLEELILETAPSTTVVPTATLLILSVESQYTSTMLSSAILSREETPRSSKEVVSIFPLLSSSKALVKRVFLEVFRSPASNWSAVEETLWLRSQTSTEYASVIVLPLTFTARVISSASLKSALIEVFVVTNSPLVNLNRFAFAAAALIV